MNDDKEKQIRQLSARAEQAALCVERAQKENSRLQGALDTALERADAAETMKSRILANISHEVRTPMNGILGMTELLLDTELDAQQTRFTNTIVRSTESLLFVVNDMLDFSVLHHGKLDLEENIFFFGKTVRDVCEQYSHKAQSKNITLSCSVQSDTDISVIGDEFRIRQVISNLLDNAIKFTDEGSILVTTNIETNNGTYHVSIEDTGTGIEPDLQSEIFKSFAQVDNSSTRQHGGTGLGLAIASRLAQLMGGDISMQSKPGCGSTFTFSCKLRDSSDQVETTTQQQSLKGTRVLVVDDTETNLEILALQLQQWELDVHCADSGQAALQMLDTAARDNTPFQLAILDLNMPHMDGLELAQHIQSSGHAERPRIMMLTSSVINLDQKGLREHGIVKSLTKPARQALLYDSISRIIEGKLDNSSEPAAIPTPDRTSKILLTEDDPINQEVATTMLESMGYEVIVAENGAEAVDAILQDDDIDLILMDCQMPVMDGFNATRAIRNNNVQTPIVALTANAMQGDRDLCIDAGMNDYLTKPIYQTDLSRVVEQWVSNTSNNKTTSENAEGTMNIEIDESALDAIRSLQRPGKPDILARIVNMYMDKSPELIAAIEEGVSANDCDKVKMAAHTLKSSSAYVGASSLAEACSRVEARASNDELSEAGADIQKISTGFTSVVSQIQKYA